MSPSSLADRRPHEKDRRRSRPDEGLLPSTSEPERGEDSADEERGEERPDMEPRRAAGLVGRRCFGEPRPCACLNGASVLSDADVSPGPFAFRCFLRWNEKARRTFCARDGRAVASLAEAKA